MANSVDADQTALLGVERIILPGHHYFYWWGKKEVLFKTVMHAVVIHNS